MGYEDRASYAHLKASGFDEEELELWRRVMERTAFAEAYLTDDGGEPWIARPYQIDSLNSFAMRKVHCDGRDVGKTSEIEVLAAWAAVAMPDKQMLIATQTENHLFPLMERIARRYRNTPSLAASIEEMKRTPSWYIRFTNGFRLWGRIAGPRGVNFQGMHVDWQVIDEAQEMTESAWGELFQALNGGGRRWVYGVPNGLRNAFYRMSEDATVERYNWPSSLNPAFDEAKDEELARLYGGRTSPGYINRVLGQHGAPAHAVFSLDAYNECVDDGVDFEDVCIEGDESLVLPSPPGGNYYLGADLGYARDPSELVVYRSEPPYFVNVLRVHLAGVNYARQQTIIETIVDAYDCRMVGIDAGNSGRAVAHNLLAKGEPWTRILRAIEFGGVMDLGQYENGDAIRRHTKEFMTELIARRLEEGTVRLPALRARETEYAAHTYRITEHGRIRYDKGNDHIIDADRCAHLVHFLDTNEVEPASVAPRIVGF